MRTHNDNAEHVIIEEGPGGRLLPVRAPLPPTRPLRMTGPDRGRREEWEASRAETQAIIDEMNRRTSRELLKRMIRAAGRRRAA